MEYFPEIGHDTLDSREVIDRIKDLEAEVEAGTATDDEKDQLDELKALAAEVEPYTRDWKHGVTLVEDAYFEVYAREMVEDTYPEVADLPYWVEIDWAATAENVKGDYTSVDVGDYTYWFQST